MSEWVEDPELALKQAYVQPQPAGAAPHWLRCQYFCDGQRCTKADGHLNDHEPPK